MPRSPTRFVQWAAQRDRALTTRVARDVLTRALEPQLQPRSTDGLVTAAERSALRHEVLERIVLPCLHALLGPGVAPSATAAAA